jgi:hypothetical protein
MVESSESNDSFGTLVTFMPVQSRSLIARKPGPSPRKLPIKDSLGACVFLLLYTMAYLAAGLLGITAVGWAWVAIFR